MDNPGSSTPSSRLEERIASLAGLGTEDSMRRASHAGFAAHRMVDLSTRRASMPAYLITRDEEARKIHTSSACVNLMQDLTCAKVIGQDGTQHYMHEDIQKVRRKLQKTSSAESTDDSDREIDVKKSSSTSDFGLNGKIEVRKTNSETRMGEMDIVDPAED